jgi:hypothetical protein
MMVVFLHASIAPDAVSAGFDPVDPTSHALTPLVPILLFLVLENGARVHHAQQEVQNVLRDEADPNALLQILAYVRCLIQHSYHHQVEAQPECRE